MNKVFSGFPGNAVLTGFRKGYGNTLETDAAIMQQMALAYRRQLQAPPEVGGELEAEFLVWSMKDWPPEVWSYQHLFEKRSEPEPTPRLSRWAMFRCQLLSARMSSGSCAGSFSKLVRL